MPYLTLISTKNQENYDRTVETESIGKFFSGDIEITLKPGDLFLFINGVHYDGDDDAPDGFPFSIELTETDVQIDEIRRAEIRSDINENGEIKISFKEPEEEVRIKDLKDEIVEAIQSCINGEELIEIDLTNFFDFKK